VESAAITLEGRITIPVSEPNSEHRCNERSLLDRKHSDFSENVSLRKHLDASPETCSLYGTT
jgi:hypothetical protein